MKVIIIVENFYVVWSTEKS